MKGPTKMQSKTTIGLLTLSILPILSAQPPAGVKRVAPQAKDVPPFLQQYDFGGQLRTLENPDTLPNAVTPELAEPTVPNGSVPKDFHPRADVPLTATALE